MADDSVLPDQARPAAARVCPGPRRALGLAALGVSVVAGIVWFGWRVGCLGWHPLKGAFLIAEFAGAVGGVAIAVGLLRARAPRNRHATIEPAPRPADSNRFAHAVADLVGRTRSEDLHRAVRRAVRIAPRWRPRRSADAAMAAVLIEGPRRLAMVVLLVVGLLIGVAPLPMPPGWALAAAAVWAASMSVAHVALGAGRLRVGDRVRWSYGAIGEILSKADRADLAPRRWVGTMATVVALNLAVALRGISDRWTHGLAGMGADARTVAIAAAVVTAAGACYTLATTPAPDIPDAHLVTRRLEERTARQSALVVTLMVGVIGMLAGMLPGVDGPRTEDLPVVEVRDTDRAGHEIAPVEASRAVADG